MLLNQRRALYLAGGLLAGAVVVGALVALPGTKSGVQGLDDAVLRNFAADRPGALVTVAKAFDVLGGTWVNWPLRVAALILLALQRRWVQLSAFALAVLTSEALIGTLKAAYARPRPPGALITTSGFAFPSGHAIATAVTAVGLVVVLLPPGPRRSAWELRAVAFTFLMALSRVYLRAHWFTDVLAGGLLGAGLAIGWPALLQTLRSRSRADPQRRPAGRGT